MIEFGLALILVIFCALDIVNSRLRYGAFMRMFVGHWIFRIVYFTGLGLAIIVIWDHIDWGNMRWLFNMQ